MDVLLRLPAFCVFAVDFFLYSRDPGDKYYMLAPGKTILKSSWKSWFPSKLSWEVKASTEQFDNEFFTREVFPEVQPTAFLFWSYLKGKGGWEFTTYLPEFTEGLPASFSPRKLNRYSYLYKHQCVRGTACQQGAARFFLTCFRERKDENKRGWWFLKAVRMGVNSADTLQMSLPS